MMRRATWILIAAALFLAALVAWDRLDAASAPAPGAQAAITASPGARIVTLSPAIAVILDDLGLADRIVGRHAFDLALSDAVPVVGDITGIDYERLLRVKPTDILLERNAQAPPDRLLTLAVENGWAIHSFRLLALDDIPLATRGLAELFGNDEARERGERILLRFDEAMRPSPEIAARAGRVLALYWTNPPGAAGPGSFHAEMLERLGFAIALTEGGPYITVDPEDILRMDPDSILLLMPGADPERVDELLGPLAKLDLRCVREGRVGVVTDAMVNFPATSITRVVREILEITAGWTPPGATGVN
jgi:ABC-type Fe3+-hydroxamate transport system substrate-binding protein